MENIINVIIENPIYTLLVGSTGVLSLIIALLNRKKNKEEKKRNDDEIKEIKNIINIIGINENEKDKSHSINVDDNQNLNNPLKDIDMQKEKTNIPVIELDSDDKTKINNNYQKYDFSSEEYYVAYLTDVVEKKRGGDSVEFN